MGYEIIPTPRFKKEAKRLLKKYKSLKQELTELETSLQNDPEQGTSLGNQAFKIRLAMKSKGKGKRGGSRVITYVVTKNMEVYLLTIYDKAEIDTVTDKMLSQYIDEAVL